MLFDPGSGTHIDKLQKEPSPDLGRWKQREDLRSRNNIQNGCDSIPLEFFKAEPLLAVVVISEGSLERIDSFDPAGETLRR
jgi:hypothetical protein